MKFESRFVGAVKPQLYIGLGGVGGRIVQRLHQRLGAEQEWLRYRAGSTGFLVVDTNTEDLDRLRKERAITTVHTAPVGRASALQRIKGSGDAWVGTWLDAAYVPREDVPGAGQIRVESRVGAYVASPEIERVLRAHLDRILGDQNKYVRRSIPSVEVFVFGSLAGGTCSGSFHVVPYIVRDVLQERHWHCKVVGHLLLATAIGDDVDVFLEDYVHGNTYAALKELEHLTRATYEGQAPVPLAYRQPHTLREPLPLVGLPAAGVADERYRTSPPYDWIVLVDEPARVSIGAQTWKAVADAAYVNLMTPAGASIAGARDNYTRFMRRVTSVRTDDGTLTVHGHTKHYGTFGAAVLVCPDETLVRYAVERFVGHVLETQLGAVHEEGDATLDDDLLAMVSAEKRVELINDVWLTQVEKRAAAEEREAEDRLGKLRKLAPRVSLERQDAGFWAKLFARVEGRGVLDDVATTRDEAEDYDPTAAPTDAAPQEAPRVGLRQQVRERIEARLLRTPQLPIANRSFEEIRGSFANDFQALAQEFDAVRGQLEPLVERWVDEIEDGAFFAQLRKDVPEMDAMTERFLVLKLLLSDLGPWLAAATAEEKSLGEASLAGTRDARARSWGDLQKRAAAHAARPWYRKALSRKSTVKDGLVQEANEQRTTLVQTSNGYLRAHARKRLLEALRTFVRRRAQTYAELALEATAVGRDVLQRAEELRLDDTLDVDDFLLRVEALDPLDERASRLWHLVWEDTLLPRLGADLRDGAWAGRTIAEAMTVEEKAAEREGRSTIDAVRLVKDVEARFRAHAVPRIGKLVSGDTQAKDEAARRGYTLVEALEAEALYASLPAGTTASERRRLLAASAEGRPEPVVSDMADYLEQKLAALRAKAELLATIQPGMLDQTRREPDRPFRGAILVADEPTLAALEARYPAAVAGLLDSHRQAAGDPAFQADGGGGLQQWTDPRMLMLFRAAGVLPLDAFENVDVAWEHYETIQGFGAGKPHPLHTDHTWEWSLPEVLPEALVEREQAARARLVGATLAGLVRRLDDGAFVLDVDGRVEPLGEDALHLAARLDAAVARDPDRAASVDRQIAAGGPRRRTRFDVATALEQAVATASSAHGSGPLLDQALTLAQALRAT